MFSELWAGITRAITNIHQKEDEYVPDDPENSMNYDIAQLENALFDGATEFLCRTVQFETDLLYNTCAVEGEESKYIWIPHGHPLINCLICKTDIVGMSESELGKFDVFENETVQRYVGDIFAARNNKDLI